MPWTPVRVFAALADFRPTVELDMPPPEKPIDVIEFTENLRKLSPGQATGMTVARHRLLFRMTSMVITRGFEASATRSQPASGSGLPRRGAVVGS